MSHLERIFHFSPPNSILSNPHSLNRTSRHCTKWLVKYAQTPTVLGADIVSTSARIDTKRTYYTNSPNIQQFTLPVRLRISRTCLNNTFRVFPHRQPCPSKNIPLLAIHCPSDNAAYLIVINNPNLLLLLLLLPVKPCL